MLYIYFKWYGFPLLKFIPVLLEEYMLQKKYFKAPQKTFLCMAVMGRVKSHEN